VIYFFLTLVQFLQDIRIKINCSPKKSLKKYWCLRWILGRVALGEHAMESLFSKALIANDGYSYTTFHPSNITTI
jgi:hypothetical protein